MFGGGPREGRTKGVGVRVAPVANRGAKGNVNNLFFIFRYRKSRIAACFESVRQVALIPPLLQPFLFASFFTSISPTLLNINNPTCESCDLFYGRVYQFSALLVRPVRIKNLTSLSLQKGRWTPRFQAIRTTLSFHGAVELVPNLRINSTHRKRVQNVNVLND